MSLTWICLDFFLIHVKLEAHAITKPKPNPRVLQSSHSNQTFQHQIANKTDHHGRGDEKVESFNCQTMETNGSTNGADHVIEDDVDEGLAALRRQPSIRDRKKVQTNWVLLNQDYYIDCQ